jgi:hypothetical protein
MFWMCGDWRDYKTEVCRYRYGDALALFVAEKRQLQHTDDVYTTNECVEFAVQSAAYVRRAHG